MDYFDVPFFDVIVRYETRLWSAVDHHVRLADGVSLGTLAALRVVHSLPGTCRVQDIRRELGITVGAASKIVDRLERGGLAVRQANPDDRRSSVVVLTKSGRSVLERGMQVARDTVATHLEGEPGLAQAQATLQRLLHKLTDDTPQEAS